MRTQAIRKFITAVVTILLGHWSGQYEAVSKLILPSHLFPLFLFFPSFVVLFLHCYIKVISFRPPISFTIWMITVNVNRQKLTEYRDCLKKSQVCCLQAIYLRMRYTHWYTHLITKDESKGDQKIHAGKTLTRKKGRVAALI